MLNLDEQIEILNNSIKEMTDYLLFKVKNKDWHAVADAAMDIREFEAKLQVIKSLK